MNANAGHKITHLNFPIARKEQEEATAGYFLANAVPDSEVGAWVEKLYEARQINGLDPSQELALKLLSVRLNGLLGS